MPAVMKSYADGCVVQSGEMRTLYPRLGIVMLRALARRKT